MGRLVIILGLFALVALIGCGIESPETPPSPAQRGPGNGGILLEQVSWTPTLQALMECFTRGVVRPDPSLGWRVTGRANYPTLNQAVAAGDLYGVLDRLADKDALEVRDSLGRSPLLVAASENRPYILDALIDHGAHLGDVDALGNSAMHLAAKSSHIYMLETLVARGAWLEARNAQNYTPLHVAAETGELFAVQHLVRLGADITAMTDPNTVTIPAVIAAKAEQWDVTAFFRVFSQHLGIHMMVGLGDVRGVTELLDDLPFLVDHPSQTSQSTPIMAAVSTGRCDMIPLLGARGANLMLPNIEGSTAMTLAVQAGRLDCVKALLDIGDTFDKHRSTGKERTLLNTAVRNNTDEVVAYILENGGNGNFADLNGRTPLQVAVAVASPEKARILLEHAADPNARDVSGWSPVLMAARDGATAILEAMLAHGGDRGALTEAGETPLHLAAANGHEATVAVLLAHDAALEATDHQTQTPLHRAAAGGHSAVAERLLDHGAALEAVDVARCTPLLVAVKAGHQALAERLLTRGANREAVDHRAGNALYLALDFKHIALAHALAEHGVSLETKNIEGRNLLFPAAATGSGETITWLEASGLDVNAVDKHGVTPLQIACAEGSVDSVRYLLTRRVHATMPDSLGRTPVWHAAQRGNTMMLQALASAGDDMDHRDKQGLRPMHVAAAAGHATVLRMLWNRGASLDEADDAGNTPLHAAAQGVQIEALRALLACRASLTHPNKSGQTPRDLLNLALIRVTTLEESARPDAVNAILRARAFLDAAIFESYRAAATHGDGASLSALLTTYPEFSQADLFGRSPAHWAAESGQPSSLRRLRESGLPLAYPDHTEHGYTPLHHAIKSKSLETVVYLVESGGSPAPTLPDGTSLLQFATEFATPEILAHLQAINAPETAE